MITKTYLDGRLNQLEEKLKKRIEIKDEIALHKMEADIASLKNNLELLEEKIEENRDILNNYFEKQNNQERKTEEVESSENKDDVITSDF